MPTPLANRAIATAAIKAPALNLTLGGSVAGLVVAIATVWDESFEHVFGFKPADHPGVSRAVMIAVISAVTLLWIADIIGRAISSMQREVTYGAVPTGWTADIDKPARDDKDYIVAAVRVLGTGTEFLLVKTGEAPSWHPASNIHLRTGD